MMYRSIAIMACLIYLLSSNAIAGSREDLARIKHAYPKQIAEIKDNQIVWRDGTSMPVQDHHPNKTMQEKLDHPALWDQLVGVYYVKGVPKNIDTYAPQDDPGRIRYEPFFRKMYGNSKEEVMKNLRTIYWLPKVFGEEYPLQVTMVNGIDQKLERISNELETLVAKHPDYRKYLEKPAGTFLWRNIANTNRLSPHSFGMTIDLNTDFSNYWQWDLKKRGVPISEDAPLTYQNHIPWEIVAIFEKYGFIWGGKWRHYDTMHFEYRPEVFK